MRNICDYGYKQMDFKLSTYKMRNDYTNSEGNSQAILQPKFFNQVVLHTITKVSVVHNNFNFIKLETANSKL